MAAPVPMDNYQAQSDMHTLVEHAKIHADPKRKAAAYAHIKQQRAMMDKLAMGEGKDTKAHEKAEGPKKETAEKKAGTD